MDKIARKISLGLLEAVSALKNDLENQLSTLHRYREKKGKMNAELIISIARDVASNNKLLYESAIKVIEKATEILVKDIETYR